MSTSQLVALVHLGEAAASSSTPCFSRNASHAVLKSCLASSRLAVLPNGKVLCEQHFNWMVYV